MGEIADLMINGDICEGCGIELEDEGSGFPRRCFGCGGNALEKHWDDDEQDEDEAP